MKRLHAARFVLIALQIGWMSLLFSGCTSQPNLPPSAAMDKNVLLISIDTIRIDYLEPYGGGKAKTPVLQELAEDGIVFVDATSPTPLTVPAHASLFTGLHPIRHQVRDNFKSILPDDALTLAELFTEAGYDTAGVIGSILLSRRGGFDQGFAFYDDEFEQFEFQAIQPVVERKAGVVTAKARDWLDGYTRAMSGKPFFLFVHYYDPHMMYNPPEPFLQQYKKNLYAGEVAYTDQQIGVLLQALKEKQLYDETLVVLVGDHGEGLKNHGEQTHGLFLYEEVIRVPLIIKPPAGLPLPDEYYTRQSASVHDVVPTLVDLCGLGFADNDGMSLAPHLLPDSSTKERFTVHETQYPKTYNWSPIAALRSQQWKYVLAPKPELYNLQNDPNEQTNLIPQNRRQAEQMRNKLEERLQTLVMAESLNSVQQISSAQSEVLTSLGYASGGGTETGNPDELPDPKDKIEVYNMIDQGLGSLSRGDVNHAIDLFKEARTLDPQNPNPHFNLAMAYRRVGQWQQAIETMHQAIALAGDHVMMYLNLAKIYASSGEYFKAEEILQDIIEKRPSLADAHFQLGWIDMRQDKFQEALVHLKEAEKWMPDMPGLDAAIQQAEQGSR